MDWYAAVLVLGIYCIIIILSLQNGEGGDLYEFFLNEEEIFLLPMLQPYESKTQLLRSESNVRFCGVLQLL